MIESIMSLQISGRCFSSAAKLKCFTQDKSRISIIYGKNGSGKSTLAKALCNTEADLNYMLLDKDNNALVVPQEHIHVFNEDYIKNNVEVQDGGLAAVILFGDQVDIDKQITEARVQLEQIEETLEIEKLTKKEFENAKNSASYKYKLEKLKNKLKATNNWTGREYAISGKRQNISVTTPDEIFNQSPTSKSKEDAMLHYQESMSIIGTASRGKIGGVMKPILFESNFFQNISELLAEKIEEPVLSDRDKLILEIYNQKGARYITEIKTTFENNKQTVCPYCFRAVNIDEKVSILSGIEKVLSEIAKEHQEKLHQYKIKISNAIDLLDGVLTVADQLKDIYSNEYVIFEVAYRIINSLLVSYMHHIDDKINSVYVPILYSDSNMIQEICKLNSAIDSLENKRKEYNQHIEKINKSQMHHFGTARLLIGNFMRIILSIKRRMKITITVVKSLINAKQILMPKKMKLRI